ncbi:MAG: hypothetical protein LBQ11_01065 [Candidatus Nomurabacteria bacterium]|jgi:cell division protein FtsL|nr:hypothetical protein [Candidatus Nomurabacteria bacterium]
MDQENQPINQEPNNNETEKTTFDNILEQRAVINSSGKKHGIVKIIVIIVVLILAAGAGFFGWKYFSQQKEINGLQTDLDKTKTELSSIKADSSGKDTTNFEKGKVIVSTDELMKILKEHMETDPATGMSVSVESVYNSEFEPFQVVKAGVGEYDDSGNFIGGGLAYFYSKGENGAWQYGFHGNGLPECSAFNGDARYAFSTLDCFPDGSKSPVTVGEFHKL